MKKEILFHNLLHLLYISILLNPYKLHIPEKVDCNLGYIPLKYLSTNKFSIPLNYFNIGVSFYLGLSTGFGVRTFLALGLILKVSFLIAATLSIEIYLIFSKGMDIDSFFNWSLLKY